MLHIYFFFTLSESDSNMAIMKLSHCSASVKGKEEIILLCGQVNKGNVSFTLIYFDKVFKIEK